MPGHPAFFMGEKQMTEETAVTQPPAAVESKVVYFGKPSQLINVPDYVKTTLLSLVIALIPVTFPDKGFTREYWQYAYYAASLYFFSDVPSWYLNLRNTVYLIELDKITWQYGVLDRHTWCIEMYRVQDVSTHTTWWERRFNMGAVLIRTSDSNNPWLRINGVKDPDKLRFVLQHIAKASREAMGIQEVNMARV